MRYRLNTEDENPLWRNYMDNVNNEEQWMKEVKLNTVLPSKSFGTYSEDEFEQMLVSDNQFNEKMGNNQKLIIFYFITYSESQYMK